MFILLVSFVLSIDFYDSVPSNSVDLYSILGVKKNSPQKEILKAYKRFLVKKKRLESAYGLNETLNSDLKPNEKVQNQWKQIEYAYTVLSDSTLRELYDSYGFSFINQSSFSVFGYQSEFQALFMKDFFNQQIDPFGGIIIFPLHLTLLDAMNGIKKTVKVIQTVPCHCPRGGMKCSKCRKSKYMTQPVQYTVEVPPGAPDGYKIFVKDLGDSSNARGASDVMFVIRFIEDNLKNLTDKEIPDGLFQRIDQYGSDLLVTKRISLAQAIECSQIEIDNLDGEKVVASISQNLEEKIVGKGLPIFNEQKKRGDLYVRFIVDFPESLTEEQKKVIGKVLPVDEDQYQ